MALSSSMSTLPRLNAGDLRSQRQLQARTETTDPATGLVTPSWTTVATVWGKLRSTGVVQQLESEQSAPRQTFDYTIRRRSIALPLPLRVVGGPRALFAIAAIEDDTAIDATVLRCVEGLDVSATDPTGLSETVTLVRGTDAPQPDGSTARTWAPIVTGLRLRLEDAQATLLARLFGAEISADLHGTAELEVGVRLDDGLVVTAGRHVGQSFLVVGRTIDPRLPAQAYLALALQRTTEVLV